MATKKKQTKPAVAKPDTAAVNSTATPNVTASTPALPYAGPPRPANQLRVSAAEPAARRAAALPPIPMFAAKPDSTAIAANPDSTAIAAKPDSTAIAAKPDSTAAAPPPAPAPLTAAAAPPTAPAPAPATPAPTEPAAPTAPTTPTPATPATPATPTAPAPATPAPAPDSTAGQLAQEQPMTEVDRLRLALRMQESSGNYTAKSQWSSASGAYQYIDDTWRVTTKKHGVGTEYKTARDAPPEVQDRVTSLEIADIIRNRPEGMSPEDALANKWFTGNYQGIMSEKAMAANRGMDAAKYRAKFKTFLAKVGGAKLDAPGPGPTSTPADATRTAAGLIGAARNMAGSGMSLEDALALVTVPDDVKNKFLAKFDPTKTETEELDKLKNDEQKALDAVYGAEGTIKKSPESFIDAAERKDLEKKYPVRQPVNRFAATLSLAMGRMASALTGDQTYYTQARSTIDKAEAEHQADQERLNQVITTEANRQKLEQLQIDYAMLTRASERLKEKGNLLASREAARRAADIGIETQRLTNAMSIMLQDRQDANKMANAIIEGMMRTGAVYDPKTGGFSKPTPAKDKDDKLISSSDALKSYNDVISNATTVLRDPKADDASKTLALSSLNTLWDTYAAPWDTDKSFNESVSRADNLKRIFITNGMSPEEASNKLKEVVKGNLQIMVNQSLNGEEPYSGVMFTAVQTGVITAAAYNKWAEANGKAKIDVAKPVPAEEKDAAAEKPKPRAVTRAEANWLKEQARQKALAGRGSDRGLVEAGGETAEMQRWGLVANPPKYQEVPAEGSEGYYYGNRLQVEIDNAKTAYEYWKKLEDLGYEDPAYNVAELKKTLDELLAEQASFKRARSASTPEMTTY